MKIKQLIQQKWHWVLTILVAIGVYVFWFYYYPYAMLWREQMQLFLWNGSYLLERLAVPGGLARYLSEFLVQFFYDIRIGALIMTAMIVGVQLLTWRLIRRESQGTSYFLSFIPAVYLWFLIGDMTILMTLPIAIVLVMTLLVLLPQKRTPSLISSIVAIPLGYWLVGPVIAWVVLYQFRWLREKEARPSSLPLGGAGGGSVCYLLSILLSSRIVPYPLHELFQGLNYSVYGDTGLLLIVLLLGLVVVALPYVGLLLRRVSKGVEWIGLAAVVLFGALLVPQGYLADDYEEIEYDVLLRKGLWQRIIHKSEQKEPTTTACQIAARYALWHERQQGPMQMDPALLNPKVVMRSQSSTFIASELYLLMGMVNMSQRAAFEAQEAVYCNKSGRALRRLAETALITGDDELALKYISILEQTVYYRKWAQEARQLIRHPERIKTHPSYGRLRELYENGEDQIFF